MIKIIDLIFRYEINGVKLFYWKISIEKPALKNRHSKMMTMQYEYWKSIHGFRHQTKMHPIELAGPHLATKARIESLACLISCSPAYIFVPSVIYLLHSMMSCNLTSKKFPTETEYGVWKLLSCSFTNQSQKNPFP